MDSGDRQKRMWKKLLLWNRPLEVDQKGCVEGWVFHVTRLGRPWECISCCFCLGWCLLPPTTAIWPSIWLPWAAHQPAESAETSVLVLCTISISFLFMYHFYFIWLQSLVTLCISLWVPFPMFLCTLAFGPCPHAGEHVPSGNSVVMQSRDAALLLWNWIWKVKQDFYLCYPDLWNWVYWESNDR